MRIIVDIDGTLCGLGPPERYGQAPPIPQAICRVNQWYDAGHTVILYTGRHIDKMTVTYDWLRRHGVRFHHICFGKPVGEIYIDDKCLNCTEIDWDEIARRVDSLPGGGQPVPAGVLPQHAHGQ
jgi:hypothetical protein